MVELEYAINVEKRWGRERTGDSANVIVARIAAGERQALDILYQQYAQPLFGYLMTLTADHGLAEEILQDTFLAAWRGAAHFEGRSSVKTWLFGIARRQAHNVLRRRNPRFVDDAALELAPSNEPEPEMTALINADRQAIVTAIERLSPTHQEVLVLAFVHDLPYAEMAELLAVPLGTIKSRLSNARRLLRQILESAEMER